MKRTFVIAAVTLLAALTVMLIDDGMTREKPQGVKAAGWIATTTTVDSTKLRQRDTTKTPTGSNTKVGWFGDAANYGSIHGWVLSEYTSIDSGPAAANIPDTTKDTVIIRLMTADADGMPYREVWRDTQAVFHTSANVVVGDYVPFDVSDSSVWDAMYFEIITSLQDSTYVKARTPTANIQWKHSWKIYAK